MAEGKALIPAAEIVAGLNESLKTLGTDYVDIFFLHTVFPQAYGHVAAEILPAWLAEKEQPLDFLLRMHGTQSIIEAVYRYARHEPGANVVVFGTGNPAHVKSNINAILQPPLPQADVQKLAGLFGKLEGVGLDQPSRIAAIS